MSGRLPYHVNQQNHPPASPGGGVPLGMTTLADKLNASGYTSHQIGKVSASGVATRLAVRAWLRPTMTTTMLSFAVALRNVVYQTPSRQQRFQQLVRVPLRS